MGAWVQQRLAELNEHAEFNNYLIYILTKLVNEKEAIRAMAGLVLKNNVASSYSRFHPAVKAYIKENCLSSIGTSTGILKTLIGHYVRRGPNDPGPLDREQHHHNDRHTRKAP